MIQNKTKIFNQVSLFVSINEKYHRFIKSLETWVIALLHGSELNDDADDKENEVEED